MQKRPFTDKETLEKIIEKYPTPFHLYDEAGIRATAKALNAAFSWNGGYREYYAVKACPNPFIMRILKEEGCGADCSSMAELKLADAIGLSGEDIMFSSNETPAEEYEYARKLGATVNLDDITHIDFLAAHGGIPERICMRYNPGGTMDAGNGVMGTPEDAKYGMTRAQIFEAAARLKAMGAKHFGLHAFLASNTLGNVYYPRNARVLMELAVELHEKLDIDIFMVNLSGGVGIPYRPEEELPDIAVIGEGVRKVFEEVMVPAGLGHARIATELGRFMTGPHGLLVTKAVHEKHTYREYIGVDACAANLMRPAMYGAYHHITVMGKEDAPCDQIYDVVGSLCENNDKFAVQRALPKIDMGDILVIHDAGAHGFSMGYNYNGRLRSAEILLEPDGGFRMIRRAETLKDYFATFDFDPVIEELNK